VPVEPKEMQIVGVEHCSALQRPQIRNDQPQPFKDDEPLAPKVLNSAVYVNSRQAGGVGYISLGWREVAGEPIRVTDRLQSQKHLAKEMGDSFVSRSLGNIHDPLAVNGLADELLPPKCRRDVRRRSDDPQEEFATDLRNFETRYRGDRMIHSIQDEEVKIAKIARDGEVDDLPTPIFQRAIVARPPLENEIE